MFFFSSFADCCRTERTFEKMTYFSDYMVNVTCGESDVWIDEPTVKGIFVFNSTFFVNRFVLGTILYSIVTPCICLFGICGNIISLIVLSNKELKSSIYTYLRRKKSCSIVFFSSFFFVFSVGSDGSDKFSVTFYKRAKSRGALEVYGMAGLRCSFGVAVRWRR